MIPDTAAALLALLGCVAPGLVFQLQRERLRPREQESALREASRVALTSLVFTAAATGALVLLARTWQRLPDFPTWAQDGQEYAQANPGPVALFLVMEVVLACALAAAAEKGTRPRAVGDIAPEGVLWKVARMDPDDGWVVRVEVRTAEGTAFRGNLRHYSPAGAADDREIALGGRSLERLAAGACGDVWERLTDHDAVYISGPEIRHLLVQYVRRDGAPAHARAPKSR